VSPNVFDLAPSLSLVSLVTGKGGVGKTTVAAGLAFAQARRGGRALFVEFGDGESGRRALGISSGNDANVSIEHVVIEPREAIKCMATPLFGSALLARVVLGNFAMRRLLSAAPGLRELAQLWAVHDLASKNPGTPVIVDMPATGHGIAWLRVPAQLRDMIGSGPLHRLTAQIADELVHPERCSVIVVTLPEPLVLKETLDLCHALDHRVGIPAARLVINRLPIDLGESALAQAEKLAQSGNGENRWTEPLLSTLQARNAARQEALVAVTGSNAGGIGRLFLPDWPTDPTAAQTGRWLESGTGG